MKPYPAYKDSGVEWLGEIPEGWEELPLKRFVAMKSGEGITSEDIEELGEFQVFGGNGVRGYTDRYTHEGKFVLVGRQGALCGNVNVAEGRFFASEHAVVVNPTADIDVDWLARLLESLDLGQYSTSAAQPGIGVEMISRIQAPVPPLDEQSGISTFLDRETTRIDELIGEQEALVASLAERRASAVSHATESKVHPLVPLRRIITSIRQGWSPNCEGQPADGVDEWGVLKTGCVNGGVFRPAQNKRLPDDEAPRPEVVVREGEIVVSRASTRELVGSAARVQGSYPRLMLSDLTYALAPSRSVRGEYVAYAMAGRRSRGLLESMAKGTSSSMQKLSQRDILDLTIHLPPIKEQAAVAASLDEQTSKIDTLATECRELIALLKERRTALISAAVTGKIDVRTA